MLQSDLLLRGKLWHDTELPEVARSAHVMHLHVPHEVSLLQLQLSSDYKSRMPHGQAVCSHAINLLQAQMNSAWCILHLIAVILKLLIMHVSLFTARQKMMDGLD